MINPRTGSLKVRAANTSTGTTFQVPLTMQSGSQFQLNANGTLYLGNVTSTGGAFTIASGGMRSEERRVGKEWSAPWSPSAAGTAGVTAAAAPARPKHRS